MEINPEIHVHLTRWAVIDSDTGLLMHTQDEGAGSPENAMKCAFAWLKAAWKEDGILLDGNVLLRVSSINIRSNFCTRKDFNGIWPGEVETVFDISPTNSATWLKK